MKLWHSPNCRNHYSSSAGALSGLSSLSFFARFGVKVTLIQRSEHILSDFDTDAAIELEKVFRRDGMTVFYQHKIGRCLA